MVMFAAAKPPPLSVQQRLLWDRLNRFVQQEGGWLTSQRDTNPLRMECQTDSPLPDLLKAANHEIRFLGVHERLMPTTIEERRGNRTVTTTTVGVGTCHVWQIELTEPKKPEDPRRRMFTERLRQIEAQREAPKPLLDANASPESAIPKPPRTRWKKIPEDVQEKIRDALRSGTHSYRIAQTFGVGERSVIRIKAAMGDNAKTSA